MCIFGTIIFFNVLLISIIPGPDQPNEAWILKQFSQLSMDLDGSKLEKLPWQPKMIKICKGLELLKNNSSSEYNETLEYEESFVTETIEDVREKHNAADNTLLINKPTDLFLPSIIDFLPHVSNDLESIRPVLKLSQGKVNVSMIIGIPTVKRQKESYLSITLRSIFEHISKNNKVIEDILIIVMIAEYVDLEFVNNTAQTLQKEFGRYIDEGYLDIIAPSPTFYPDFSKIELSFGDSAEQVKWRSKQNLDYAYLMMYAKNRGAGYYVQLEDDVTVSFKYYKCIAIQKISYFY